MSVTFNYSFVYMSYDLTQRKLINFIRTPSTYNIYLKREFECLMKGPRNFKFKKKKNTLLRLQFYVGGNINIPPTNPSNRLDAIHMCSRYPIKWW